MLLKNFFAAFSLCLIACGSMPKPPHDLEACVIDLQAGICYRHRIPAHPERMEDWVFLGELPREKLDKAVGFEPQHYLKAQRYYKELREWGERMEAQYGSVPSR